MPISHAEIAQIHPQLYHMAQFGSWSSVLMHGLLSTSALLDLYGISGEERDRIESGLRRVPFQITDAAGHTAWIRDQRPMSHRKLASCLRGGLSPEQWYRALNERVFFWLTEARLKTLMQAYGDRPHLVLEVDTAKMLERHGGRVLLTPMNTGCTSPMAFPRGMDSFLRPDEYPFAENAKKKGGRNKAIVEFTVLYSVPNIAEITNRASHKEIQNGKLVILDVLHERDRSGFQPSEVIS